MCNIKYLPPVALNSRKAKPNLDYNWIESDKQKVIECFQRFPTCWVRAADAEMYILAGRRRKHPERKTINASHKFRVRLAQSLQNANLIGLPRDYINQTHPQHWDIRIVDECKKLNIAVNTNSDRVVSAFLLYHAPELLSELINNKKVLWINFNAHCFLDLLQNSLYRTYYGFRNITSFYIDIPDGKGGWIFESSMDKVVGDVCKNVHKFNFDIAVVGAGAMANLICIYIRDVLGKSAIDAGAVLSAFRGQVNRGTFKPSRKNECLVWKGKYHVIF